VSPAFRVTQAEESRRWKPDDGPEKAIDHLTLEANGRENLVTRFRNVTDPMPKVGEMLEGELAGQDNFDKGRQKFKAARKGGGSAAKDAYWERKEQRDIEAQPRIERQHSQEMALRYVAIKAQLGVLPDGFDFADVVKMTDAFQRDLAPPSPPSDVPGDTEGLPPARDL
jgi:hypothetical protein